MMYNDLFTVFGLTVHGYGLAIGVGIVCAILLAHFRAGRKGLVSDTVWSLALLALIFGFVGAKLLYAITDLQTILRDPLQMLTGNGFVVYGGIIGGAAAILIYCRVKKLSFLRYFDLLIPSVALAQGFGRIGCFLAGCCYGRETDCFIGITFKNSQFAPNGVKLIPTELIMSAGNFLIAGVLLLYAKKNRRAGQIGGLYLILYSVGRFLVEFLRGDDIRGFVGTLSTSQFVSVFTVILGCLMVFTGIFSRDKKQPRRKADGRTAKPRSNRHRLRRAGQHVRRPPPPKRRAAKQAGTAEKRRTAADATQSDSTAETELKHMGRASRRAPLFVRPGPLLFIEITADVAGNLIEIRLVCILRNDTCVAEDVGVFRAGGLSIRDTAFRASPGRPTWR